MAGSVTIKIDNKQKRSHWTHEIHPCCY